MILWSLVFTLGRCTVCKNPLDFVKGGDIGPQYHSAYGYYYYCYCLCVTRVICMYGELQYKNKYEKNYQVTVFLAKHLFATKTPPVHHHHTWAGGHLPTCVSRGTGLQPVPRHNSREQGTGSSPCPYLLVPVRVSLCSGCLLCV